MNICQIYTVILLYALCVKPRPLVKLLLSRSRHITVHRTGRKDTDQAHTPHPVARSTSRSTAVSRIPSLKSYVSVCSAG